MLVARKKRESLRALVRMLECGVLDTSDADAVLGGVMEVLSGCSAVLGQGPNYHSWHRAVGVPAGWPEFHERHRGEDPTNARLDDALAGTWYLVGADSTRTEKDTDLIAGFDGFGLSDVAIARLYSPFADDLFFAIFRERGARGFSEDDRLLLRLLTPLLSSGFATKRALAALGAARGSPQRAKHSSVEVVFPGRRVEWTPAARNFWRATLGEVSGAGWTRLERMIAAMTDRFASFEVGGRSQLVRPGVRVEIACVRPRPGEVKRLLVLFSRDSDQREVGAPSETLLSPRQREIARRTAQGASRHDIAAALGISPWTVHGHLKAIYSRLRISTRAELALWFASHR